MDVRTVHIYRGIYESELPIDIPTYGWMCCQKWIHQKNKNFVCFKNNLLDYKIKSTIIESNITQRCLKCLNLKYFFFFKKKNKISMFAYGSK